MFSGVIIETSGMKWDKTHKGFEPLEYGPISYGQKP